MKFLLPLGPRLTKTGKNVQNWKVHNVFFSTIQKRLGVCPKVPREKQLTFESNLTNRFRDNGDTDNRQMDDGLKTTDYIRRTKSPTISSVDKVKQS